MVSLIIAALKSFRHSDRHAGDAPLWQLRWAEGGLPVKVFQFPAGVGIHQKHGGGCGSVCPFSFCSFDVTAAGWGGKFYAITALIPPPFNMGGKHERPTFPLYPGAHL